MADVASYYFDLQLMVRQHFDQCLTVTNGYSGFMVNAKLELQRECVYMNSGYGQNVL